MSRTIRFLAAVVLTTATCVSSRAQTPQGYESEKVETSPDATVQEAPIAVLPSAGLSDWVAYRRNLCCLGPVDGPHRMGTEFFLRSGPSVPIGGENMSHVVGVGWTLEGGARFLYFDLPRTSAWTVEVGMTNSHNRGDRIDEHFPLRRPVAGIQGDQFIIVPGAVRAYNRTLAHVGLGREWYLWGAANTAQQWRVGVDAGGRYGTAKCDFFYFPDEVPDPAPAIGLVIRRPHRTDVIGAAFTAIHTDLEFPRGCCTYFGGVRGEWAYTWSDILQQPSDLMEINALLTIGVRY